MNYTGNELFLFAHANNWKRYWSSCVSDHISGDVLEVGSGLGANINHLYNNKVRSWTALEPDQSLLEQSRQLVKGVKVKFVHGELTTIDQSSQYDTIIYIDVLEHIERDEAEIIEITRRLRPGGCLVILAPAFQFLYSPFDAAVGHHRRYSRSDLARIIPHQLRQLKLCYLDSAGMVLSLLNSIILRHREPTPGQINFWDRFVVPVSRLLDPMIHYSLGRSLVGVWTLQ